jgi:hypothetical protein
MSRRRTARVYSPRFGLRKTGATLTGDTLAGATVTGAALASCTPTGATLLRPRAGCILCTTKLRLCRDSIRARDFLAL